MEVLCCKEERVGSEESGRVWVHYYDIFCKGGDRSAKVGVLIKIHTCKDPSR